MPIPASSILPTLDEVKPHLNKVNSVDDDELQQVLDDAVSIIESRVGPLDTTTITEEVHAGGSTELVLRRCPVVEVVSASYWDGTPIDVDDLEVHAGSGIVSWGYNTSGWFTAGARNVRVTYTVGRDSLPGDLRRAILRLTSHLWEQQRGTGPTARREPEFETPSASYLLPYDVQSLIEPFLLAPSVA